ncbi:MAG: QueT transporter family protein [Firmicutes bacterium]|nr:QueT transporter family protein [Bacillota bacterium]
MSRSRFIALAAGIASIYASLTVMLAPISYGTVQIRVSEALTLLAAFTPAAIPGLFVGCLISNIYMGNLTDIIFGSLTTLVAAFLTHKLRKRQWLVPLPPILLNAVVVGYYLTAQHGGFVWMNILSVGAGQFVACFIIPIYFIVNFESAKIKVNKLLNPDNIHTNG